MAMWMGSMSLCGWDECGFVNGMSVIISMCCMWLCGRLAGRSIAGMVLTMRYMLVSLVIEKFSNWSGKQCTSCR